MLTVNSITKSFAREDREPLLVLDKATFAVMNHCIMVLMGPNGSGKTTLLNIICGELCPDSGGIWVDNQALDDWPAHRRYRMLGRVHQDSYKALAGDLTVAETLAIAQSRASWLSLRPSREKYAMSTIDRYCPPVAEFLSERLRTPTRDLSGGQRQLLAMAVAVLGNPRVLLLDEHLASLDSAHRAIADRLLESYVMLENACALATTHDRQWADTMSHCIGFVEQHAVRSVLARDMSHGVSDVPSGTGRPTS